MAINKTIKIKWEDKAYSTLVDMRLIDRIEESVNLYNLVVQMQSGDVRYSRVAQVVTTILNHSGCGVDGLEVWDSMFGGGDLSLADVELLTLEIFGAIFPDSSKKKDEAELTNN